MGIKLFDDATPISAVDEKLLAKTTDKLYTLPGRSETDENQTLSGPEIGVIVSFVKTEYKPTMTWHDGVMQSREKAGIKGNSRDFGLVNWIIEQGRQKVAGEPLTLGQMNFLVSLIKALESKTHFDANIQARLQVPRNAKRVESMLDRAAAVMNRGDFQMFTTLFGTFFGTLPARKDPVQSVAEGEELPEEEF